MRSCTNISVSTLRPEWNGWHHANIFVLFWLKIYWSLLLIKGPICNRSSVVQALNRPLAMTWTTDISALWCHMWSVVLNELTREWTVNGCNAVWIVPCGWRPVVGRGTGVFRLTINLTYLCYLNLGWGAVSYSRVPTRSLFPGKVLTFDDGSLGPGKVLSFSNSSKRSGKSPYFLIKSRLMNRCLM